MKMKILYDYEIFVRQKFGGISKYFYELINRLCLRNELEIVLYMGINDSGYDFSNVGNNIDIINKSFKGTNKLHFLFNTLNKIRFNVYGKRNSFDIVHKTYYSNVGLDLPSKKVITIHDMTHEIFPQYFAKSDNTAILKKYCLDKADGIVCVSENTKQDLKNIYNIEDDRIRVIYHGVSMENMSRDKKLIDDPYILYVGQRWGYKNFNLLLSVFKLSEKIRNNFKLVCFGGGEFNYSERLYIGENSLHNNVVYVDGEESMLANLYSNAELFVYTSLYEGFGFPPLEAMEFGCPVLASSVGSVIEILGDAAILFDPNNIEDLFFKMTRLLEDNELRELVVEKGRDRAKLFSWDKSVNEHLKFYNEINDK